MQRVILVRTSGPIYLSSTARLFSCIAVLVDAIGHRLVLQVTLAALIANRAIQRMVDQQEFHHPFTGLLDHRRFGRNDWRFAIGAGAQIAYTERTGSLRLWRAAFDFHKAHAAIAGDGQALVETEARHFRARLFTRLQQRISVRNFHFLVVDDQLRHLVAFSLLLALRFFFIGASRLDFVFGRGCPAIYVILGLVPRIQTIFHLLAVLDKAGSSQNRCPALLVRSSTPEESLQHLSIWFAALLLPEFYLRQMRPAKCKLAIAL